MPIRIDRKLTPERLRAKLERVFSVSAAKIVALERTWDPAKGTPVFTVRGRYTSRGWTEWTQGFQYGSALLQYEATGEPRFLELGREATVTRMAPHVTHMGVHDHGFNNVSTYGNLWRMMGEGRIPFNRRESELYALALKASGAVQAARWTALGVGRGYIYSFNGPHSLFIDTMRSLRSLALAHRLGQVLMGERDRRISLLQRLVVHGLTTAAYGVYDGEGRDLYDVRGRVAHESVFNVNDGSYRCPNSQQGFSPFSTWTRGLAWAVLGFAEELEFLDTVSDGEMAAAMAGGEEERGRTGERGQAFWGPGLKAEEVRAVFLRAAQATADYYLEVACADGVPVWDTGAPHLHRLGDYGNRRADPYNAWEPVDSSAAAIAAQGLLRLATCLEARNEKRAAIRYRQAALTTAATLMDEPYLSVDGRHQGLLLHSVYHRPNGWDPIAAGQKVPNGESSQWGDYHLREVALQLLRRARGEPALRFFGAPGAAPEPGGSNVV